MKRLVIIALVTLLVAACAGCGNPAPVLAFFVGDTSSAGTVDGTGAAARFNDPFGVAADGAGNLYLTDRGNHTIRKITPAGVVTTFAGTAGVVGNADGTGAAASFDYPVGIATDSAGNVYVADYGNYTIRKITPAGVVTTLAGAAGTKGSVDGARATARFNGPLGVATDRAGNIYVTDAGTPDMGNTIRKITPDGVVTTFAGTAGVAGSIDGTGAAARFDFPRGIATDRAGNVYVADFNNHTIRKITPAGVVTTLAGKAGVEGSDDGAGAAARFDGPVAIATDSAGNFYVADELGRAIRKITPAGMVSTVVRVAGQSYAPWRSPPERRTFPAGVAVSGTSLYVTLPHGVAVVRDRP